MDLFCVLLFCVGASVTLAVPDHQFSTEEQLASSPFIQNLLHRIEMLEQLGATQAREILTLKAEMSKQGGYMKRLRYKLHSKDRMIQRLLKTVGKTAEDQNLPTRENNHSTDPKVMPKFAECQRSSKVVRRIVPVQQVAVAFSVGLYHSAHMGQYTQNIVYDHVETNVGNGYNPNTGDFTAPVSGIYVMSVSMISLADRVYAHMMVNRRTKVFLFMQGFNDVSTQTMVFELNQGDTVSVMARNNRTIYGHVPTFNTFSGFLLHQTYPTTSVIG